MSYTTCPNKELKLPYKEILASTMFELLIRFVSVVAEIHMYVDLCVKRARKAY